MANDDPQPGPSNAGPAPAPVITAVIAPESLRMHETTTEALEPMKFSDFMDSHGKLAIDFQVVWRDFSSLVGIVVPDNREGSTYAIAYANKVIYEISNEIRAIKPKGRDRSWNLIVPPTGQELQAVLNVASYKNVDVAHGYSYRFENRRQLLSIRLANMVAVEVICKNLEQFNDVTLTPLGGAVFAAKDLEALSRLLVMSPTQVACIINRSTVGTPFQMAGSEFACAVTAVVTTTRKMKNQDDAKKIINKVIRGYVRNGAVLDRARLTIWSQYATGGIPEEYTIERLLQYMTKAPGGMPLVPAPLNP